MWFLLIDIVIYEKGWNTTVIVENVGKIEATGNFDREFCLISLSNSKWVHHFGCVWVYSLMELFLFYSTTTKSAMAYVNLLRIGYWMKLN